jgi:RNA polymerase sigma-70 factor, ECF subfamily
MRVEPDTLTWTSVAPPKLRCLKNVGVSVENKVSNDALQVDQWTNCLLKVKSDKDAEQFAKLFNHFAPRAKAFLMKSGASEPQAEETTQEAMAQVWRKANLFDPTRASATTWIFTIVRNRNIDAIRKRRRPEPDELAWGMDAPPDPSDIVEMSQEERRLREALNALPAQQREVIEKAYFGEYSHSDIAELTGLPLGTIKSRIRLGLDRLRHELKKK